jgi:hypothetical protein
MSPASKRTLTPLELAARRRNAQKSTGPRTAAGKFRAMLNSLKRPLPPPFITFELWPGEENLRAYRRLHRDLISLLLPQDEFEAQLIAHLAETWWEKVFALSGPPWVGDREMRRLQAEEEIERELFDLVQGREYASRKWRYCLERDLGGPFFSLPELRQRIEAGLPVLTRAKAKAICLGYGIAPAPPPAPIIPKKKRSEEVAENKGFA